MNKALKFAVDGPRNLLKWALLLLGAASVACGGLSDQTTKRAGPAKVEIQREGGQWQLAINGQPFCIKGAGGPGSLVKLKEAGGNSIRTWGTDGLQFILDDAERLGINVCAGIWLHHEHDGAGFDYNNPEMVKAQLEEVRRWVTRFKDHPALLVWGLGNEMEGYGAGDKAEIWKAVDQAAQLTKQLDPNHPTMTVISELGGMRVANIHRYCPYVDIVGINSYGGAASVAERYVKLNGTKPFIVTEFGPPGPWECDKTSWGAAFEPTSTEKGNWYRRAYRSSIERGPLCLGSYTFLWGQKQETTATWFGMFLKEGDKLQAVDVMTELWSGKPPADRCPVIRQLTIRNLRPFEPGAVFSADLEADDPQDHPLQVRWVVQPEQHKKLSAGAEEQVLPELADVIIRGNTRFAEIRAPQHPGGYRLFAYVRSQAGAAVANVPFLVAKSEQGMRATPPGADKTHL